MSEDPVRNLVAADMQAVDAVIRGSIDSDVALVRQICEYIINSGGKRLRPALVILAAGAVGYEGTRRAELAAIVEFIHTATLLHDDVVDESSLRRGRSTANAIFGNAASVLVGDFLYSRAFQMMLKLENMRVMEVIAEATNTIAEGEVLQLMHVHDAALTEEQYLTVIRFKTAKLFEAAARLGAILGQAPGGVEDALAKYGMHVGTAFQLIDDLLDYSGDNDAMGKNLGDDLAEGKTTLPLIYAMRDGTAAQAELVRHAIEAGGLSDLGGVVAAVRESGAFDSVRMQARREAEAATQAIAPLSNSKYRQSLIELADFAVTRDR